MRKYILIIIIFICTFTDTFCWIATTHKQFALAVIKCPEIYKLFEKTGWSIDKVTAVAWQCDYYLTYNEKDLFQGSIWGSISDYYNFEANYLKYASAGEQVFSRTEWYDMGGNVVKPTPKDLTTYTWLASHSKETTKTIFSGEDLFGVLLHHLADVSVPVGGHSPGSEWCDQGIYETGYEINAGLQSHKLSCMAYDIAIDQTVNPDERAKIYWNTYCDEFKNNLKVYSELECSRICIISKPMNDPFEVIRYDRYSLPTIWDNLFTKINSLSYNYNKDYIVQCPEGFDEYGSEAGNCLNESMSLAMLVVPRYILNTKEYKRSGATASVKVLNYKRGKQYQGMLNENIHN